MKLIGRPWFWALIAIILAAGIFFILNTDTRPECQKEVVCYDKWQDHPQLRERGYANLETGNYRLEGEQIYSVHMPSDLINSLTISDIDVLFIREIGTPPDPKDHPLIIAYSLIENDKQDPNKKSKSKKPFSGYLLISFQQDNQELYRFQIDYLDPKAADLSKRVACAIESFLLPRSN